MSVRYDEDLSHNPLLVELRATRPELVARCALDGCVACVPRRDSLVGLAFDDAGLAAHVLAPDPDAPATRFFALDGTPVRVLGRTIAIGDREIRILFEQTFYEDDGVKFDAWCVDAPLTSRADAAPPPPSPPRSLADCVALLSATTTRNASSRVRAALARFSPSRVDLDSLAADARALCTECARLAFDGRPPTPREALALDTYALRVAYDALFSAVRELVAREDAELNAALRRSSRVRLCELGVDAAFAESVAVTRERLSRIGARASALGKLECVARALASVRRRTDAPAPASVDELIPIVAFVAIKSGVADWRAQLAFAKRFRFVAVADELDYAAATLEAALEFVASGSFAASVASEATDAPRLHRAAAAGDPRVYELAAEAPAEVDVEDDRGWTPLHHAAANGCQNALLALLHVGARSDAETGEGDLALHLATDARRTACVDALVYFAECRRLDPGLSRRNRRGDTALHLACRWGYDDVARSLIEAGADPSERDERGETAFDVARDERVMRALRSGRPVDDASESGGSRATRRATEQRVERSLRAIRHGDVRLACFHLGVDVDASPACHPLCSCGNCEGIDAERPTYVDVCDSNGDAALHAAAEFGSATMCKILLENGASPDVRNREGLTALHLAARNGNFEAAKTLVDFGAALDSKDRHGNTPLHLACVSGNVEIVESILRTGYLPVAKNELGKTASNEAIDRMYPSIVSLFEELT